MTIGEPGALRFVWLSVLFLTPAVWAAEQSEAPAAPAPAAPSNPFFASWLSEVRYLITPEEQRAAEKLQLVSDFRDFVNAFWQRRDPSPGTAENELRTAFEQRLVYVNQHFGSPETAGYLSDRGRIYILLGPPERILRVKIVNHLWQYTGAASQQRFGGPLEVRFQGLKDPKLENEAALAKYLKPPKVDIADLERLAQRPPAAELPLELSTAALRQPDGKIAAALLLRVPYKELSYEVQGERNVAQLQVSAMVLASNLQAIDPIEKQVQISITEDQLLSDPEALWPYRLDLSLPPGRYVVQAMVEQSLEGIERRVGTAQRLVDLEAPQQGAPSLSDLLLAQKVESRPAGAGAAANEIDLMDYRVTLKSSANLRRGEPLVIAYAVYSSKRPGSTLGEYLNISQALLRFGQELKRSQVGETEQFHPNDSDSVVVSRFDTRPLEPGDYNLRVEVENPLGNGPVARDLSFTVQE